MTDNEDQYTPLALIVIAMFFGIGYGMGSTFSKDDYLPQGRNEGIIFCTENKRECATEYNYLKLKENQK